DFGARAWATARWGARLVLGRHELAIPTQDRLGRDEPGDLRQERAPEVLTGPCQASALGNGEAEPAWAEVLTEHAVLLAQVDDRGLLATRDPADAAKQEELDRER